MFIDFRNGDSLDLIADLKAKGVKIDILLTDPPYMIDYKSEKVKKVNRRKLHNDTEINTKVIRKVLYAAEEILAENAAIFCFTSWQKVEFFKQIMTEIGTLRSCIVWHKNAGGMGDLKRDFSPSYELILYATKGEIELPYRYMDFIAQGRTTGSTKSFHPTQKPVDLLRWLIRAVKGYDIQYNLLDPFAGSGSSLLAGYMENCNCYGAELDEEYHKDGLKWLIKNTRQQDTIHPDQVEIFDTTKKEEVDENEYTKGDSQ